MLNILHKQSQAQNEWARLALHGACMVHLLAVVRVTMWTGGKGETE